MYSLSKIHIYKDVFRHTHTHFIFAWIKLKYNPSLLSKKTSGIAIRHSFKEHNPTNSFKTLEDAM